MIEFRNVGFAFQGRTVLDNVTFSVDKGDFAVLLGSTGSGKTSLVQLIIGEELPMSGEIFVGGKSVNRLSKNELARYRRSIGIIGDEIGLLEEKSIAENVALPLEIAGSYRKDLIVRQTSAQLASVNLNDKAGAKPKELSHGEYQRAAIARALVTEPLVLIADCPTDRLDAKSSAEILAILADQNIRGMTIFLTLSDLSYKHLFPAKTVFYRLENGTVERFLPETQE